MTCSVIANDSPAGLNPRRNHLRHGCARRPRAAAAPWRRRLRKFWLGCLLTLTTAPLYAQSSEPGAEAALVVAQTVVFEQKVQRFDAVGSARALRSVTLYPAVADRVTEVNIEPGTYVQHNAVLLRLDARRQEVELNQARIQLADAERTATRLMRSLEQEAVSQSELDDAMTVRDLLEVEVTRATTELEDRTVRAPFAGVVGLTDIQVGDRINTNTPITSIDDRAQLLIDFRAPEAALAALNQEPSIEVSPWQQPGATLAARIVEIDSRIDPQSRTIRVRAMINNDGETYRPGTSFRVALQLLEQEYASVPEAAVMWGPTSAYVWRILDDRAERVDVQIKQRLPGRVLIESDLEPGERIIVEGVQNVREGQPLRYVPDGG